MVIHRYSSSCCISETVCTFQTLNIFNKTSESYTEHSYESQCNSFQYISLVNNRCSYHFHQLPKGIKSVRSHLRIIKSHVGSLNISDVQLKLQNSWFIFNETVNNRTKIVAHKSNLSVNFLHVENFQGTYFIQLSDGFLHMRNVKFVNCVASYSLIDISAGSVLSIDNSTFLHNSHSLVDIHNSSLGIISNSTFKSNTCLQ